MFSKRALSLVTVALLLASVAIATYFRVRPAGEEDQEDAEALQLMDSLGVDVESAVQQFSTDLPNPVSGVEVIRDTLWLKVRASGEAVSTRQTVVKSRVEGLILDLPIVENRRVAAGELLTFVDTTEYALQLMKAQGDLRRAEAEFRLVILFDTAASEEIQRARREAARTQVGLDNAEIAVREAEINLDRTRITAPFGGRIADLKVVEGQWLSAGEDLMTVVALDPIKVEVGVLEKELQNIEEGRFAEVEFVALPGEIFTGRVRTVNPMVDENKTGRVTIFLDNPDGRVKPGMTAAVLINSRSLPDRILIPREAVTETTDGTQREKVFLFNGEGDTGKAAWVYVTTGESNDDYVEIIPTADGTLEPGQIVLVDGHHYLAHDIPVQLVESVALAGGRPGG